MLLGQDYWSIDSLDWAIEQTPECTSLASPQGVGALQISCFRKRQGPVSEGDIAQFRAEAVMDSGAEPILATFGNFTGLVVSHEVRDRF